MQLARLTGCTGATSTNIRRRLLPDLDVDGFAQATRLTIGEAAALTLTSWADRYPPIARSLSGSSWPTAFDDWLFNHNLRYCPDCLAGDDSPVQQQYGGPWKKVWHLPIAFACPQHHRFLHEGCPKSHPADPGVWRLIVFTSGGGLHPAQCRQSGQPGKGAGRHRRSCGTRLDQPTQEDLLRPSTTMLEAQQRLLTLLDPQCPAEDAIHIFTGLRVITALLHASWPPGRALIDPAMVPVVTGHVRQPGISGSRVRPAPDMPPGNVLAAAAMLTAAANLLKTPDLSVTLARHLQASWPGRSSKAPWAGVLDRHQATCSPTLRQAAEPSVRAYRRLGGSHGLKAPARTGGYQPEHIPAFLEDAWSGRHLAQLNCRTRLNRVLRRTAAATLVQWSAGGSLGDAAAYLGINPKGGQFALTNDLYQWLDGDLVRPRFTTALKDLTADLGTTPALLNYRHRRDALQTWSLHPGTWTEIVNQLPPVPGPVQPAFDDRKRQEASAFVWAYITQGELRFAPRPLEARQPEPIRRTWAARRGATWHQLTRPDPLNHYAHLRALLTKHAQHLASEIDKTPR